MRARDVLSHPVRVRGLKPARVPYAGGSRRSHPVRVRGLKLGSRSEAGVAIRSHPVRVRGLKHLVFVLGTMDHRRTPCGCVG